MRRTLLPLAAIALGASVVGCGGSEDEASGCTPDSKLTVGAEDELKFDADSYETGAGCVEITYENNGGQPHTLLIRDESGFKLTVGDTDKGTIDLPAGSYEIYCDIAGHESAGMVAELTVS